MSERVNISSINQLVELGRKYSAIFTVGSLSLLRDPISKFLQQNTGKSCNCKKNTGIDLNKYRPQFEAAMAMLSASDQQKLKSILNTEKICYYRKNDKGQLNQICF